MITGNNTPDIELTELTLEVTRCCNMACAHCLRGEPEQMDMSDEIMRKAIRQYSYMTEIFFAGGEPSIAPSRLIKALDLCIEYEVPVYQFGLVTNAKRVTPKFIDALERWADYTGNEGYISISGDQYHEEVDGWNILRLEDFCEARRIQFHKRGNLHSLVGEGRAYYLCADKTPAEMVEWEPCEDRIQYTGMVYVNAKGQVLVGCDYSYETQEDRRLCTVDENIGQAIWAHRPWEEYDKWMHFQKCLTA